MECGSKNSRRGMTDQDQSRQQLLEELVELRQRVAALEGIDAQRRRAEEELAKSKAILTATIECLPFDFFALDPTGRCILQNAVSRRYYGDALGKTAEQVCPDPRTLPRWIEGNRRALAGQLVEEEAEWQVGGERRQFHNIIAPIQQDGTLYGVLGVNMDVTARHRAEDALRESESRYRALAESTRDIIYILDRQGTLLYANQAASQCIGIPCDDLVGKRQADLFPPEMAKVHIEKTGRVFATGEVSAEDELFHFGPHEVWLRVHLLPLRDDSGQITSVMGVCHDITARKRTEESLQRAHDELERRVEQRTAELTRANEELAIFRKFADASGQGFSMADLDGRVTYLNPALCRMLGEQRPEDVIGKHLSACFSEQSNRIGAQEILPALEREGYWQGELPLLSRQVILVPAWHNTFLIRDERGMPLRIAVVISDITERKRAEEALRQSERRFRNYFEQGLIGMAVTSVDKRWLEVNDRLCEILGYSREELLQTNWAAVTHPDDIEANLRLGKQLLAGEIERFTLNKRYLKKDGSIVYTTIHTRVIRNEDGTIDHTVTLIEDITERKLAEEALQRERRTLEHMLQASDHERRLIAYDIHDGLAQQLAAAIMQFQVFNHLQATKPKDAAKAFDAGTTMLQQSHAEARRLISGVRPPILDESGVMAAIAHLIHDPTFERGAKIEFRSRVTFNRLAPVVENVIYRIVQEGLTNARNHSQSKKIVVSLMQRGDHLSIEVRDWGVGFDPTRVQENRFGLEGIRERVRLLGGTCTVQSELPKGTAIIVELPVTQWRPEEERLG
jgi:two-component system sensor histidine kinase UhpB